MGFLLVSPLPVFPVAFFSSSSSSSSHFWHYSLFRTLAFHLHLLTRSCPSSCSRRASGTAVRFEPWSLQSRFLRFHVTLLSEHHPTSSVFLFHA
jgi:hypothetical protein